jgi:hypothetical protein
LKGTVMSVNDWVSVIMISAAIAAIGIALAWVVARSEMASSRDRKAQLHETANDGPFDLDG